MGDKVPQMLPDLAVYPLSITRFFFKEKTTREQRRTACQLLQVNDTNAVNTASFPEPKPVNKKADKISTAMT